MRKLSKAFTNIITLIYLASQFTVLGLVFGLSNAAADPTSDWLNTSQSITFTQTNDTTNFNYDSLITLNKSCEDHQITVSTTTSTGCFSHVASGYLNGTAYAPNNSKYGCNVQNLVLWGLPTQNKGFAVNSSNRLNVYTNISGELKPIVSSPNTCTFASGPTSFQAKDKSNNLMYVYADPTSYSSNGSWIITEASNAMIRVNTSTGDILPFASSPNLMSVFTAISDDGRFAAVYSKPSQGNIPLTVYDLSTCGSVPNTITGPVTCSSRNINSSTIGTISNFGAMRKLRFMNNSLLQIEVYTSQSGVDHVTTFDALAPGSSSGLSYLAMGDSFSSGEGTRNYLRGTDTSVNKCHTSLMSYPKIISTSMSYSSNSMKTVACSGAKTLEVLKDKQYPTLPDNNYLGSWLPGYKPQLNYVDNSLPGVVTITMGGNDIGFKSILVGCVESLVDDCYHYKEDRKMLADRINRQFDTWVSTYKQIKSKSAPNAKLYVVGYPQIVSTTGSCGINVRFSSEERAFGNYLISYLNRVISKAAEKAGATFVDTESALNGYRLCEATGINAAVNGLTAGNDIGPLGNESYHPNLLGQQLLASTVLSATSNFTTSNPAPNTSVAKPEITDNNTPLNNFLNAPVGSGGVVNSMAAQGDQGVKVLTKGQTFNYHLNGIDYGLKPSTSYNASLNSTPYSLGNFTTDSNGDLDISVTVPSDVDPGLHLLNITGQSLTGENISISDSTYVNQSSTDFDGDGNANTTAGCNYYQSSGVDADEDSIDDACDGFVGIPPMYRARNGVTANGENSSYIYIDRNSTVAGNLGINDYNPTSAEWVTIAQTDSSSDASTAIANFTINDLGVSASQVYDRFEPTVSTRTSDNGCVSFKPSSLAPLTSTSGVYTVQTSSLNTNTCRSALETADTDSSGTADNAQTLYRARNGNSSLGEDPNLIYVERNLVAAEAQLGVSDYDADSDGWSLIGTSSSVNTGTYSNIALVDSAGTLVASNGSIPATYRDSHLPMDLQSLRPEVVLTNSSICSALEPNDLSVVKYGQSRTLKSFTILTGQTCT